MNLPRPSETITAIAASVIGAVVSLLAALGVNTPAGVTGPLVILVGWLALFVTARVAKRQRAGSLRSAKDGTVTGGK